MKRFTLGRDAKDRPVILLNGVQQKLPYMPFVDGVYIGRLEIEPPPKSIAAIEKQCKRGVRIHSSAFIHIDEYGDGFLRGLHVERRVFSEPKEQIEYTYLSIDNGRLWLDSNVVGGVCKHRIRNNGTNLIAIAAKPSCINKTLASERGLRHTPKDCSRGSTLTIRSSEYSLSGRMFLDEEQWLVLQARYLRERARKDRTQRKSSPNSCVYREMPVTKLRDLLMFTHSG